MEKKNRFILWFRELTIEDVPLVGGKNASLGEMYSSLAKKGVKIPNGFAVTATAYRYFLAKANLKNKIAVILKDLNTKEVRNLAERGEKIRELIKHAEIPPELRKSIVDAYRKLCDEYGPNTDVAVRSSATAEDLPDASFAGQQETFLNIQGEHAIVEACKKCFASLFTNRAISYRHDKGFPQLSISLSIGIQKMVRSDLASSGVIFTIDTESGFKDVVFITAIYGLGENIVQGAVNPDEYYVFKPTLKKGNHAILSKRIGDKKIKMIYAHDGTKTTKNIPTPTTQRESFVLTDQEVLTLAQWACVIEDHYSKKAKHWKPMDIEWAKDGKTNEVFIVQARPETVQSQKDRSVIEEYALTKKSEIIIKGKSVGSKIGAGKARIIRHVHDIAQFKQGEVLVTDMTDPDWEPVMKMAAAIVTNRGGRTCFTGNTKILTNYGFMTIKEIFGDYDGISVPSLNRLTLKIEWKPILATMKRKAKVIEIETSLTGRMQGNTLQLTPDHKMITLDNSEVAEKEIADMIINNDMLLLAQYIPPLHKSTQKEQQLAYLLGAISTDGNVSITKTHGEVQFIQKETEEKEQFIAYANECLKHTFQKEFKRSEKNISTGFIRGKPAQGSATAFRCYSKQIAYQIKDEQLQLVKTLLQADDNVLYSFLAGVIDGDGSWNKTSHRINIYCSKESLLQAITVSCLRLGIVPQITKNRSIWNVQIVEKIDHLFQYTKRVKGEGKRKIIGTRFFGARQLFGNHKGRFSTHSTKNLVIDANKIVEYDRALPQDSKTKIKHILSSDTRMQRVSYNGDRGIEEVYNITVADNHNYIVFTDRYTPIVVNNCHAAIVSRELGVPCVVGTNNATEKIKSGQDITVSCAEGEEGIVYKGKLPITIKKTTLKSFKRPKTKIMMNVANPDDAFNLSFIPNDGVGLAREEFIINDYVKIHPLALLHFKDMKDNDAKRKIEEITQGYNDKVQFFIDKLAAGIAMIGAAFYPKDVIVRFSDFKSNEYANLIGGKEFEPKEENPMIGWRGASRYYSPRYEEAFALECKAIRKVREDIGLTNVKVMIPFCRTPEEGRRVLAVMKKYGLSREKNGLEVYVMCEIPSNVMLADEFSQLFDGFSIGSNDLTQLTLGLDRDSALVSHLYDERNAAVKKLIWLVVSKAKKNKTKIGICGQAPSDFPDFADFLVKCGIDSISLNPDSVLKTMGRIFDVEKKLRR